MKTAAGESWVSIRRTIALLMGGVVVTIACLAGAAAAPAS
jgi:hypothetical protein